MLEEFQLVFSNSKKTQWLLFLGPLLFVLVLEIGAQYKADLQHSSTSVPAPLQRVGAMLEQKYDKAALAILLGCWFQAFRCYKKDRRRLLGL